MLWVFDHFWSPVIPYLDIWDAVQIVNSFITILHLEEFITLCHIYTAYNLTLQYSIPDVYT
jgi:hypothetical protein